MRSPIATAPGVTHTEVPATAGSRLVLSLVLMVADGSLERTAQRVLIQEGETLMIGRHDPARPTKLAHFAEHRPGMPMPPPSPAGGLPGATISHEQLRVTGTKAGLHVKVIGARTTLHNGQPFTEGLVCGDDTLTFVGEAVLLCIWTPMELPMPPEGVPLQRFGEADVMGIRGESAAIWELRRAVEFAAGIRQDVLVLGESGTGKTAVSRAIHLRSPRKNGPIAKRSCRHFTESVLESQLFGTAQGFVGAGKQSFDGLFPEAEGGTIVLDEIGLAPLWLQETLLSTLDDGVYTVVGAARASKVDVRIVGTTNEDPKRAFRPDFDARLALRIFIPPVREHRDDIGLTLRCFLEEADTSIKHDPPSKRRISPTFVDFLVRHPLPTNARQIRNVMLAALGADTPGHVKLPRSLIEDMPPSKQPVSVTRPSAPPVSQPREREPAGSTSRGGRPKEDPVRSEAQVREALEASGWDATAAAALLGISRGQMVRLMDKLGVKRPGR
jgi:DNA-binding NtrC family response regulator